MNINLLPADVLMIYKALLKQGWVPFSEMDANPRNNWTPTKWFPGIMPFTSPDADASPIAEPLVFALEGVCFGVFDAIGFGYYDYNEVTTNDGTLDEDKLEGKVVFFPYENFNAYR